MTDEYRCTCGHLFLHHYASNTMTMAVENCSRCNCSMFEEKHETALPYRS